MRMKLGSSIDSVADVGHAFVIAATALQIPVSLALKKQEGLFIQTGDYVRYLADVKEDSIEFLDEDVELFRSGSCYAKARFNFS